MLSIQEEVLGLNHEDTLRTKSNYGAALIQLNRYKEAERIFEEVMKAQEDELGPNHEDTLKTKCNYAVALLSLHRSLEA